MIAHIILFQPSADLSEGARQEIAAGLAAAARGIPSVKRLRVGRRVLLGGLQYEAAMAPYEYAAIVEFEDRAGLEAYLAHPMHQAIGGHFTASASSALAYDYELVEPDEVARLLG